MRKTLFGLLGAGLVLMLGLQACGPDDKPVPPPPPDGGSWVFCDEQDAGACAPGQTCLYVELYERSLCVNPCDAVAGCQDPSQLCCGGGEDGGTGGYCLPREVCEQSDAGSDGGSSVGDGGSGSDGGTNPTDAGTNPTDAGTNPTDAGTNPTDAGTNPTDAGTNPTDAGTNPTDGGFPSDAGTDGGTRPDAGPTDAGTPDAGPTDAGSPDAGPIDAGSPDAGPIDAGSPDAGPIDAGTPDSGTPDAGSPDAGPIDAGTPDAGSTRIRIMASNLTSGNQQSYDPGHGTRLMQGVNPDVILIQEFNYGDKSAAAMRGYVTNSFGASFHYYQEPGAQIPNGIISRWPILASGKWEDTQSPNREFAWARIDIPGPKDLWAISVHLLTRDSPTRNSEASQLVGYINQNVPQGDYLVIGGDLNTDNRSEPCFSTFSSVVATGTPYPADKNGNGNTNASRGKPYDHVLVDGDLRQYQIPTVIGSSTFSGGLVLDSRVYTPLSEISPVQSGDSSATNMQHMGVIKDFLVPNQ
ncbi:endonuclease/exonuclease/phosphatase family protein [Hyalangium rubrum]|uniref:Endonuclease n=1 Tax=Hyalangium rubrum TaxID=3103134 RepID=A0ABU5H244_9BACT|nr:endonuclease/exonuclease/phosphatase family protein [Hyalangium sp. s54d21]MDY7226180.1 endonuclease [Hyalangium sp. s54d21]